MDSHAENIRSLCRLGGESVWRSAIHLAPCRRLCRRHPTMLWCWCQEWWSRYTSYSLFVMYASLPWAKLVCATNMNPDFTTHGGCGTLVAWSVHKRNNCHGQQLYDMHTIENGVKFCETRSKSSMGRTFLPIVICHLAIFAPSSWKFVKTTLFRTSTYQHLHKKC